MNNMYNKASEQKYFCVYQMYSFVYSDPDILAHNPSNLGLINTISTGY